MWYFLLFQFIAQIPHNLSLRKIQNNLPIIISGIMTPVSSLSSWLSLASSLPERESCIERYEITFVLFKYRYATSHCTCKTQGSSWSWSYGSWIYNYLCNQCLSPLTLWVRTPSVHGEVCLIQHYVIQFISELRQVGDFLLLSGFLRQ